MSQSSLAKALGTSQPAIARLEAGGTEPTLRTIVGLSRALGKAWIIGPNGIETAVLPTAAKSKKATA